MLYLSRRTIQKQPQNQFGSQSPTAALAIDWETQRAAMRNSTLGGARRTLFGLSPEGLRRCRPSGCTKNSKSKNDPESVRGRVNLTTRKPSRLDHLSINPVSLISVRADRFEKAIDHHVVLERHAQLGVKT